jgi:uncharacterized protein YjbJ (UPF0337 family)
MSNEPNSASPIQNNWDEQKIKLKAKYTILTNEDLLFEEGKKEEMMGKLQVKLGKSEKELSEIIERL